MSRNRISILSAFVLGLALVSLSYSQTPQVKPIEADAKSAESEPKLVDLTLAGGAIELQLPETWKAPKKPRSRIVEREFAISPTKEDKTMGRLTMMRSGGSVKVNVDRWFGQFTQVDGKATKDVAKVTTKKINDQDVTLVDISGTFSERMGGGPFAPGKTIQRENYRMLGGIVQTKAAGQYFFKLYGPKKTIAAAQKPFLTMLESVKSVSQE